MDPHIRDGGQPLPSLLIKVGEIRKLEPDPEVAADILDTTFDFALGLRPIGLAGPQTKAILVCQIQVARMPPDLASRSTTHHGRLHIVVEDFTGYAAKIGKRMHMTAEPPRNIS